MFEKILVPLDGSEHSLKALKIAVQIAQKFNGKITLIHVYSIGGFAISPTPVHEFMKQSARLAPASWRMVRRELRLKGFMLKHY